MISEFKNCADWILVNDFTIHERRQLSDRPFMITRVPKQLDLELRDFALVYSVRWTGEMETWLCDDEDQTGDADSKIKKPLYQPSWAISARAVMVNRIITVFHMERGVIAQFDQLDNVYIRGIQTGKIGGKHNATALHGIAYSGMTSREVPEKGLMEGEPGLIFYADDRNADYLSVDERKERLCAELYVEQEAFDEVAKCLSGGYREIEKMNVQILAELFQGEVEASLAETWMTQEYGIRLKDKDDVISATQRINARLEYLNLVWKAKNKQPADAS